MTICPNKDHLVNVSATISPVTQVALVAVKRASSGDVKLPSRAETGRHNKKVPVSIKIAKLSAINREGPSFRDHFPNIKNFLYY